jgi:hypothetical protein
MTKNDSEFLLLEAKQESRFFQICGLLISLPKLGAYCSVFLPIMHFMDIQLVKFFSYFFLHSYFFLKVVVQDSFLVLGGTDTFGTIKDQVWKYDFTTSTWTSLGTLPSPRSHFTAFLHKPTGRLCIWGGKTTIGVYNGPVQVFFF